MRFVSGVRDEGYDQMLSEKVAECDYDKARIVNATEPLGKGSFGTVWEYQLDSKGEREKGVFPFCKEEYGNGVVFKRVDADCLKAGEFEAKKKAVVEEACMMQLCCRVSRNFVRVVGIHAQQYESEEGKRAVLGIWCERCACDVGRLLKTQKGRLSAAGKLRVLEGVCDGVEKMHGLGLIHRDLKWANVLVTTKDLDDATAEAKVGDLGCCKFLDGMATLRTVVSASQTAKGMAVAGTPETMAPEVFNNQKYDSSADVFSLGIMMYELLYEVYPLRSTNAHSMAANGKVWTQFPDQLPGGFDQSSKVWIDQFLGDMCCKKPKKRPSIKKVLQFVQILCKELRKANKMK